LPELFSFFFPKNTTKLPILFSLFSLIFQTTTTTAHARIIVVALKKALFYIIEELQNSLFIGVWSAEMQVIWEVNASNLGSQCK